MREGLEGDGFDIEFFRFRQPLILAGEGAKNEFWLIESLKYIDFSYEVYVRESFGIMWWSKGGVSFDYIDRLSFKDYEVVKKEAMETQKISTGDEE